MGNNEDKPKKERKPRKPRTPKEQKAVEGAEFAIDPPDAMMIAELIQDSLDMSLEEKRKQKTRRDLFDAVCMSLEEFMRNFTVVGFDLQMEPVIITKASTPLDGEALSSLMKKFYADYFKTQPK